MEIVQFIFSNFWIWAGAFLMIWVVSYNLQKMFRIRLGYPKVKYYKSQTKSKKEKEKKNEKRI